MTQPAHSSQDQEPEFKDVRETRRNAESQPNLNKHESVGGYHFEGESLAEEYVNQLVENVH